MDAVLEVIKAVVGPAVVSTVVTLIVTNHKEKQAKKLDLSQSAWEVCQTLERYTVACSRMIEDVNESIALVNAKQAEFPSDGGGLPSFAFPESINWKAFEGVESYQIRGFNTAYEATKWYVSRQESDDLDPGPDRLEFQRVEAAKLGKIAWKMAGQVRAKHGLPNAKLHPHDGHVLEVLVRELDAFDARELERKESAAALHKNLVPPGQTADQPL